MQRAKMQHVILISGLAVVSLLLGLGLWKFQQSPHDTRDNASQAATVLTEPRALPEFELADHHGDSFGVGQLREQWSLLFFGFTRCPDICPNTLGLLKAVDQNLKQSQSAFPLRMIFISVDPEYDQPEKLKSYVEYFDPGFTGVTGQPVELQKLTDALYMPYTYVPAGEDDYSVEHSGALVLVNPQAQAVAYFSPPLQLQPIVAELRKLVRG